MSSSNLIINPLNDKDAYIWSQRYVSATEDVSVAPRFCPWLFERV